MWHEVRRDLGIGDLGAGTRMRRALAVPMLGALTMLAAVAGARPAAASGGWQSIGPSGGVARVTIDPSAPATLYAAAGPRLFKTMDGGRTWLHADAGLAPTEVMGPVTVDPVSSATLYVVTGDGGPWRSTDGGASWQRLGGAPADVFLAGLVVDPAAHRTLYAAAGNQVWRSVDGGMTWASTGAGLPAGMEILCLAIDPHRPALLYAGTVAGVFKSANRGATWSAARAGIDTQQVLTLTVDPFAAGTLWAGTQATSATQPQGLFVSHDGGATWARLSLPAVNEGVNCLAISPARGHPLYACSNGGVWRSDDHGRDWQAIDDGLAAASFGSLVVDPSSPDRIYTGVNAYTSSGPAVYKSENGGASWQGASDGIYSLFVTALAVDPTAAGTVYVGTTASGLLKSTDDGATWATAGHGLRGISIQALALDPLFPTTVYAETNRAFFTSHDSAADWFRPGAAFPGHPPLVVAPQATGVLYSAAKGSVYATTDGGAHWAPLAVAAAGFFTALAIAPSDPATLYLANFGFIEGHPFSQVLASHDGGATFVTLPDPFSEVSAIAVDPVDPGTLYVGGHRGAGGGVWKSADGGQTFDQLPGTGELAPLLVDPANPSVLYGASRTPPADVLVSRDAGATWTQLAPGLPGGLVDTLTFGPPGTLYAGTDSASVYRLALATDP